MAEGPGGGTRLASEGAARAEPKEGTREGILAAALCLVLERPPWSMAPLTYADVARAAGVSERTVYRYFSTQASLQEAVARRWQAARSGERDPAASPELSRRRLTAVQRTLARRVATGTGSGHPETLRRLTALSAIHACMTREVDGFWSSALSALVCGEVPPERSARMVEQWRGGRRDAVDAVAWSLDTLRAQRQRIAGSSNIVGIGPR
ncbi:MAG TPA: helix-turn-helix domain-containing protein [Acidimicrobiales bacterium]|nr:helix-turn-helix domain-containing protein [Acidimicrobiales bacterium]